MSVTTTAQSLDRFNFLVTEDGSPSLRFRQGADSFSESMHNLKGAFGETIYIYGKALESTLENKFSPHIISLGLGIGYNEILSAAMLLHKNQLTNAQIDSFELDPELRDYFRAWVKNETLPTNFASCYDKILSLTAAKTSVDAEQIKFTLLSMLKSDKLRLREALSPEIVFDRKYSCFLFDAFSSKTSPELWSEEFLVSFLNKTAEPQAVFSTYACTGVLKRVLRDCGFELDIREGFSSKRDCTFAIRKPA